MEIEKEKDVGEMYVRFQKDLEFVQMLANPYYISYLVQRNYFQDQAFLNYLKYLNYFREAEYIKFIQYPQCLKILELVQKERFRQYLVIPEVARDICDQQYFHWLDLGQVEKPKAENNEVVNQENNENPQTDTFNQDAQPQPTDAIQEEFN